MLYIIVNIIGVILEVVIALSFFNAVADRKKLPAFAGILIVTACTVIQSAVISLVKNQTIVTIVLVILIFGLSFIYNLSWFKRVVFSAIILLLFMLTEMVIGLLLTVLTGISVEKISEDILYYLQGVLMSKLIMFVLIKIIGNFSTKSEVKVPKTAFVSLIILPLTTFLVVFVLSEFTFESREGGLLTMSAISSIMLIMVNILVFYMFEYQIKMAEAKNLEQMVKQQLEYKAEYYKELSRKQEITNKTMHDLKNQLFALREELEQNPSEGMDRINNICEDILSSYSLKFTGIEAVDALITSKYMTMQEKNISFTNSIYISSKIGIDTMDLCVVIGNLLDNAVEANETVDMGRKLIDLNIRQQQSYLTINVTNAISHSVNIGSAGIATTKKDKAIHGFGLKSINEIVKKYNGNCTYSQSDDNFEVLIIMKSC